MEQFLTNLLRDYGIWAALLWALIETDLIFLVIGAFASTGHLSLWTCFPAAVFSALTHDTVVFWLAHHRAEWVRAKPAYQKVGPKVERIANKVGPWELSLCRPLYGTRYPSVIFWGLQKLSYPKFWFTNGVGLILWAGLLTGLGYFLGDQMDKLKAMVLHAQEGLLAAVAGGIGLYVLWRWLRTRKQSQGIRNEQVSQNADVS
jgi:membrane protein DedA with SNARE-associated domain